MHDSYTPLSGAMLMFNMAIGEVAFGGVGSGLYGMLVFAIITVFVAIYFLIASAMILITTAIATSTEQGQAGPLNSGAHGFSEILYAFTSQGQNNGSAFAGLTANTSFYNTTGGISMLVVRFLPMVAILALAGALAMKQKVPVSAGTLPTDSPLFVGMLVGVVVIIGGLTFFPAYTLGPIAEHFLSQAGVLS
jgi:K+-transporting ATPase ATPase A chain